MNSHQFSREDAEKLKELIYVGQLMSNVMYNASQGQMPTPSQAYDLCKQWDAARLIPEVFARLDQVPHAFDPIEMGA